MSVSTGIAKEQKFIPFVPKQRVTKDRVTVRLTDEDLPDEQRYLYYADIHSHNSMKAVFSAIDDMDERGTRLYLVIGRLDRFFRRSPPAFPAAAASSPLSPVWCLKGLDSSFPCGMERQGRPSASRTPGSAVRTFRGLSLVSGRTVGGAG